MRYIPLPYACGAETLIRRWLYLTVNHHPAACTLDGGNTTDQFVMLQNARPMSMLYSWTAVIVTILRFMVSGRSGNLTDIDFDSCMNAL